MINMDRKGIKRIEIEFTPEALAEEVAKMNSIELAKFFNRLGELTTPFLWELRIEDAMINGFSEAAINRLKCLNFKSIEISEFEKL